MTNEYVLKDFRH